MKFFIPLIIVMVGFYSCSSGSATKEKKDTAVLTADVGNRQLNINVLWDLSDRIDTTVNPAFPQHYKRDIEVMKSIASYFKKDMEKRGAYKAKGRVRVFFSPTPENTAINVIAAGMSCDLSAIIGDGANRRKKELHDSIEGNFFSNATEIYRLAISGHKGKKGWDGSDIWRFFKNDVNEYCIDNSGTYRNILVILTDGYIYHKDSKDKQKNRTAYILPELLKVFRNNPGWQKLLVDHDYGLICTRKDLQNLEVLVLEITPSKEYKNDEDIIKTYLGKWFEEMGIQKSNYACYNTDLPEYTRKKIENFLNR